VRIFFVWRDNIHIVCAVCELPLLWRQQRRDTEKMDGTRSRDELPIFSVEFVCSDGEDFEREGGEGIE
jgi:hypothetical protein